MVDPFAQHHHVHPNVVTGEQQDGEMVAAEQSSTQVINSMHMDYIHKVVFDTYGRRMATCSADRCVRVWDLQENGDWILGAQWQAHRGSVNSLCWAHPEFGTLLATCGSDHDAKIWEETGNTFGAGPTSTGAPAGNTIQTSRWNARASLTEARRSVTCLEFAPRQWGLRLAVGSADGCVRIYEAVDIMNLSQWPLAATLEAFAEGSKLGCTCLSWCNGRFEPPTLVVGGPHLLIYRYHEASRAWQPLLQLPETERGDVLDVAWAPNVGRRFHYLASAEDHQLRIYKLARSALMKPESTAGAVSTSSTASTDPKNKMGNSANATVAEGPSPLVLESSQSIPVQAWRCQWNVTGTVLASAGDGGVVQLFKSDNQGQFIRVAKVQGDRPSQKPKTTSDGSTTPMET